MREAGTADVPGPGICSPTLTSCLPFTRPAGRSKTAHQDKRMKTLVLIAVLAASAIGARAGDLWQWAPNNWSYTDNHGRSWSGFQWAPGHYDLDQQLRSQ